MIEPPQNSQHRFRTRVRDDHPWKLAREQRSAHCFADHVAAFQLVARLAKAARLDNASYTRTLTALLEPCARSQSFAQLIGADGDDLDISAACLPCDGCRAMLESIGAFTSVESVMNRPLGNDEAADLSVSGIDAPQCLDGAVGVDGEQDTRNVGHFTEQGFCDGGILM
jgi:hypothetical protein